MPKKWTKDDQAKLQELEKLVVAIENPLQQRFLIRKRISTLALIVLNEGSPDDFAKFLPWLLNPTLFDPNDQEIVLCAAIRSQSPTVHQALLPLLSDTMKTISIGDTHADSFLFPAFALARCNNLELIETSQPYFLEALKRSTGLPTNFGNLACAWLDIGSDPETLIAPLKTILDSQSDNEKLTAHLCSLGFIKLLNHPRITECEALKKMTIPFAGQIFDKPSVSFSFNNPLLLVHISENKTYVAWQGDLEAVTSFQFSYPLPMSPAFVAAVSEEKMISGIHTLLEQIKTRNDTATQATAQVAFEILNSASLPESPQQFALG